MDDEIGIARIGDAAGEPLGDAQALLDLAQQQHAAIGRQVTAVEFGDDAFAGNR